MEFSLFLLVLKICCNLYVFVEHGAGYPWSDQKLSLSYFDFLDCMHFCTSALNHPWTLCTTSLSGSRRLPGLNFWFGWARRPLSTSYELITTRSWCTCTCTRCPWWDLASVVAVGGPVWASLPRLTCLGPVFARNEPV